MKKKAAEMKTMTCRQMGGACDLQFHGSTFDQMAEQSQKHGMEMMLKGDPAHLAAMDEMRKIMKGPGGLGAWFNTKREEFEAL
jgi:hypothetical protein